MELTSEGVSPILVVRAWEGPHWVEMVQGEAGLPAWGVQIGHATADGTGVVIVSTIRRESFFQFMGEARPDPLETIARSGLFNLMNATMPLFTGDQRERYQAALWPFIERRVAQVREWPVTRWTVDGHAASTHLFSFDGAWVVVSDLPLVALGDGVGPDGLQLVSDRESTLARQVYGGVDISFLNRQIKPPYLGFPPTTRAQRGSLRRHRRERLNVGTLATEVSPR